MDKFTFSKFFFKVLISFVTCIKEILSILFTIVEKLSHFIGCLVPRWNHLLQKGRTSYHFVLFFILLGSAASFAQNYVPFNPRFDQDLKGDILLIGNNILGPSNNAYNNNNTYNHNVDMRYIDIDGDPSTFSSSSADLVIPNPLCYKIVYAGLYWGAVTSGPESITNVKFKGPSGGYNDIVGTVIYDAGGIATGNSYPYACYADVTAIVTGLATNAGTYTLANVSSAEGRTDRLNPYNGTGYSAGWSLFIVYEDPTLPSKSITSFDGFSAISSAVNLDVPISGFRTVPAPAPVRANFAFAALEGDKPIQNDRLRLNGVSLSSSDRPARNFFNSSVTQLSGLPVNNRNPNSTNTLGFDTGILNVPNPGNGVIANNATSAIVRLESTQDAYFEYFFALAVEIIEPKVLLTKIVEDALGNDIGGMNVTLGQQLNYVIGFQNIGNDDATNMIIRDVLPINTIFNYPADMGILPSGVSVQSYNPVTREIIFEIDDSVIEINDPVLEIRFNVQVVPSCNMLSDACSNSIDNQAYTTYAGVYNPSFTITDDPSINTNTGCLLVPKATNFLVGVDDCQFASTEVLCGDSVVLTAANGYSTYSWSTDPSGTPVIGTTQSITVTSLGTYYVHNTAIAPCLSIDQEITVVPFGNTSSNPVIPFADEVVMCPNDGKLLPNIFLCGANASRVMQTGITDTSSIIWEKLNEASCSAVSNIDCANENTSCTWTQVGSGPDYTANAAGQYRVVLNYTGGCFNRYYFNVYQNLLNPTVTTTDIICNTPGQITVGGVPNGYEYSLDGTTYQSSNIFSINTQNIYTVYIRQVGVSANPCIFTVPDIQIRARNFTVSTIITPPLCNGGKGSVKLAANDVRPQYFYSIYSGATLVNSVGPIAQGDYTFANLSSGTYTVNVSTEDGCAYTADIVIIDPPLLTATAAITKPLTCTDGEITVYPVGGTPPYFYFINSTTDFQDFPEVVVTTPGLYDITVVDSNNCSTTTSITVNATPPPVFNITKVDVLCANTGDTGSISVNVTNTNGNSLRYSIDNGTTFVNSPIFNGLAAGTYDVVVEYTFASDVCLTTPQTITISPTAPITGTATLTIPYTCITNGTITVSGVSGGNGPYTYSINGVTFQAGNTFSGLTNGNYTVTIRDINGCTVNTNSISIAPLNPPTDLSFSNSALTCPTNVSIVTINSTTGGVGTLEYRIVSPVASATAYQASTSFAGLAPGTYTFEVKDANDCTYTESYTIVPLPALTVVGQKINDITCFGASDGAARFTVSGSTGFTYTINGGASIAGSSPINLTGLAAASYTVVITDSTTNCQATASVTIDSPAIALSLTTTVTPLTCNANGSVVINATGGWGGNSYTLTQPDTTVLPAQGSNTFSNLSQSGTYTATVTDSKGCVQTITFSLITPTAPTASIAITSDYCFDPINGATLEVTAAGGITPYEYNINGGPFGSSNVFANLTPGNYTIIIRDAYGCTVTLPAQTIAPQLTVNTVLTKELDCSASPDAVITGTITGGYSPFTYAISINGGAYSALGATGSPFVYTTSTDGTYQFQITDARGCQSESNVITINPITNPIVTGTTTQVSCNGVSDGSVQLVGSGGSGGYTYSNDNITFVGSSLFPGLAAGSHTFYIKDSKNCTSSVIVTITQPTPLVATASATEFSCSATNTYQSAVITIAIPTTGTAPYQYSFNNGATFSSSNTLTVNDNGSDQTFTYVVRDANGCLTVAQDITLNKLDPPTDLIFASSAVTCSAPTTTVTLTSPAGVGVLQYETIAPSPAIRAKQTSNSFSGLAPGTYVFRVTDANGCYYTESYTIVPVTPIAIAGNLVSDVLCFGGNNGSGTYTVSGNATVGNYTFALTAGTLGSGTLTKSGDVLTLSNVVAGTYTVRVTDSATGCFADATIIISEPANALVLSELSNINANCFALAQVTVTASGGTPSYTYAFVPDGASPAGLYTSSNTAALNPIPNSNWDVWVMDANGCTTKLDIVIASDPVPNIDDVALQCYTGTPITITLSGNGLPPLSYSINGGAYQAIPDFSINAPGIYNVSIKDGNGCIASKSFELKPELLLDADMTQDLTCAVDASITLTPSGGTGIYSTYEVSYNGGGYSAIAGSPYTATLDGNYQFRVTDDQGCIAVSNMIIVTPKTTPEFTYTKTDVSCNGGSDGSIVITTTAGTGIAPYQYSIDNGLTFQVSNVFNGLNFAGSPYNVIVRDSKNCDSAVTIVNITEPALVGGSIVLTQGLTCGAGNAAQAALVTVTGSGGTAPYTYSFDGGLNYTSTNTYSTYISGLVTAYIKDANGCVIPAVLTIDVLALDPPVISAITGTPIYCAPVANTTSTVTISHTNGVGALTYAIVSPASAATNITGLNNGIFTGLTPGTYIFEVTDANGCTDQKSYTVNPVTNITVAGILVNDVSCYGGSNGAVDFMVSNFAPSSSYSYTINGGASVTGQSAPTISLTVLSAGDQTIVVTDETTGCTDTVTVTVSEPAALTLVEATNINANCNTLAQVIVAAGGGTSGYKYAFVENNNTPVASDYTTSASALLDASTNTDWDVWVMDANGCTTKLDIVIASDPLPTVTASVDNQCAVTSGFTITASPGVTGVAPFTYSIDGASYQALQTFTVNTPGTYTVTIKDGNGCTATSTPVTVYAPLNVSALLVNDLTCFLPSVDASIDITVAGGNAPYTYEVSTDAGATYSNIAGSLYTTSTAGNYQFRITDDNGCTKVTNAITVSTPVNPEIISVTEPQSILCNGEATAAIQITIDNTKGLAPFVFNVLNTTTGTNYGTQTSGLAAGVYEITVTDAKGCTDTQTISIGEPNPIDFDLAKVDITCDATSGSSLGSITVQNVSGGTGSFAYYITNNFGDIIAGNPYSAVSNEDHTFNIINYGIYTINVVDSNGCNLSKQITIASPPSDLIIDVTTFSSDCINGGTAEVEAISAVGSGNYEFGILEFNSIPYTLTYYLPDLSGGSIKTFTNLTPGVVYTFVVHDLTTDCYFVKAADTPISPSSSLTSTVIPNNVTCTGANNGSVTFTIDNFDSTTTSVDYGIYTAFTNTLIGPITNLPVTFGTPETVTVPSPGTLTPGQYYVTFTENGTGAYNGCKSASAIFEIRESVLALNVSASVSKNENCNELGVISAIGKDGTAPYTYQLLLSTDPAPIATSAGWASSNTFNRSAADYIVYVKDAYGCISSSTPVSLTRDDEPTIDPIAKQCFDGTPINITIVEGTGIAIPPLTYSIGTGGTAGAYQLSDTFTISAAGTYDVFIKDGNGCIISDIYVVEPELLLDASITKELDCSLLSPDAEITVTVSGGLAPFTYEVSINGGPDVALGAGASPYTYSTGTAGTYQFRVTDATGCISTTSTTVDAISNPVVTATKTDISCYNVNDGTVQLVGSGGSGGYTYSDDGTTFVATSIFINLSGGTHRFYVKDSKECTSFVDVDIINPTALVATASATDFSCSVSNTPQSATVTIDIPTTGTAPYQYSFNGSGYSLTTRTLTVNDNGTDQVINYTVKDANGCTFTASVTIFALNAPTDLVFTPLSPVICSNLTGGSVSLAASNGVLPLTYEIISPASASPNVSGASSGIFTGLAADTYMFRVTDANGCYYEESYTLDAEPNITISALKLSDVLCQGDNTGAIQYTVSNFAGNYTPVLLSGSGTLSPLVSTNSSTINLTDLVVGIYTLQVTDDITGCTAVATIEIFEPADALSITSATSTHVFCTNDESQITVTATGGTPNYTYAALRVGDLTAPAYGNSPIVTVDTNSGNDLDWIIYVKDANGCDTQIPVTITEDPEPMVTAVIDDQCVTSGFTIIATGDGIPPLSYSIGTGFQISETFTGLVPGDYFVTVKDGNGCTAVSPTAVTIYPPLDLTPTITALPTCANDDGIITVAPAGGSGVYTYAISPNPATIGLAGNVFSGIPSGAYTITITDTVTGCTKDVAVTLSAATPVTFTTSVDDVSCNGGNDGIITVNLPVSNDNPIYTYEITAGPMVFGPQNSNIFPGLVAGNYTVQVNSGRGCSTPAIVPVTQPALLTVSGVATEFGCAADNSVNTSTLTITEAGGTAPYTFSIDGINYLGSNIFDIIDTGLTQDIDIYVKDDNGCIAFNTVSILPLPTLTAATVGIVTPIDCNNTGSVAITVTGGSGNFTYQMLPGGLPQVSNIFNITAPGDYYFQVNDLTTGCTIATSAFTVAPFDLIDVVAVPTTAVTCFGDTDGALEINISGYAGPYSYTVFDNSGAPVITGIGDTSLLNPQPITGLSGGNYSVLVTETASPFCATSSNIITIASPSEPLTLIATETANVTCTNDKGTITALASGGWGSYEYELTGAATVPYSSNGTFTDLAAGVYTINVRDAGGCITSQNVTLAVPAPITATVIPSTTLLSCFGDTNATITVSGVTGGEGTNYSYTLVTSLPSASASGPQASPVFSGLGAGTYSVLITDGYNCSYTSAPIVIAQPTLVQSQLVKTTSQTCLTGTTLTLSATGGTGSYTYSDNINFTGGPLGSFVSSTTITVAPGTYVYYVRDANGCNAEVSNEIKIDPLPALVVTVDATNAFINCAGDNTGVIVAEAQGGLGNYVYTLQDASGTNIPGAVQNSPGVFTDLFAGTYQVRVDSGDCLTTSAIITITEPALPLTVNYSTTDVTCNGSNNGLLQINASGGTGMIQYAISPQLNQFFETSTFDNLAPGTYDVIVQDELGCFVYFPVTITEPSPLFLSIVPGSLIPEVCSGDMNGEFSVDITGGTEPYSVSLDDINGVYTIGILGQTQFDFTGLEGGDHVVYVRDNEGCESEWNITFPESVLINAEVEIEYCTTNTDASSNTVAVYVDNTTVDPADIDYSLDGGVYQTSSVFNDVAPGNHTIYVRHTNTCEKGISFDVEQFDPLQIAIADGDLNEIVVATTGGSGIYQYEVTNLVTSTTESFGSTESYFIYNSGDYTVTVTDSNSCIASATRYFEFIDVCITNYFTPNGDGYLDEWGPGCTSQYKDLTYEIFDRYGRKVANLRAGQKWDGRYNGAELPSGDYWYAIRLNDKKDNRQFVGHFTLYR